ncbi:MAG: VWA domain-containing protein, partial [SAR202 cluster bacterium]|nr:VWA domain-containing protein [SAR202 cluster bacterium]
MTFGQPDLLYFLIALPVAAGALYWSLKKRSSDILRIGNADLIARLYASVNRRGRKAKLGLWFVALALVVVALSRPQWGSETEIIEQEGSQVMIALDISNSMLAEDIKPNRLTRAKLEISDLMSKLGGDEVGLVLFSGAAFIQFPMTFDYTTARSFLENAHPGMISRQGTAIGEAIETAIKGFDDTRPSQKVIIILTDGEDHEGDPVQAASDALDEGVLVYTVGLGTGQGQPIPEPGTFNGNTRFMTDRNGQTVLSRLDEDTLKEIARAGRGQYFRAGGNPTAADALASELSALDKVSIESEFETRRIERFQIFLAAALVALVA